MHYSKQNILSKVRDSEKYFIVNLLSGNADLLEPEEALQLSEIREGAVPDDGFEEDLLDKGYLTDNSTENRLFKKRYFDFINERDKEEIQLFFILNYSCNFSCTYCYQDQYSNPVSGSGYEIIDTFFNYIQKEFAARRKYITVFGGEPLLNSTGHKEKIAYLLEQANKAKLEVCFVTNGYTLIEYMDILKAGKIREIQVTLDGTENIHNKRRFLNGGGKTFQKIVKRIDAGCQNHLPLKLMMVTLQKIITSISCFTQFVIHKS